MFFGEMWSFIKAAYIPSAFSQNNQDVNIQISEQNVQIV